MDKPEAVLASYATFKALYSDGRYKNAYQILSEFIKYIIVTQNLHSFSISFMKNQLQDVFGFNLPSAVIKTTVRRIDGVSKIKEDCSVADLAEIKAVSDFETYKHTATSESEYISNALLQFAKERFPDRYVIDNVLIKEFIAYLLDIHKEEKYHDVICEFILFHEHNDKIKSMLQSVREGSIIYLGLNYNINELGSIKKPLTLYFGTEILFHLAGYNGDIWKALAMDLMQLVQSANSKKKVVFVKYFTDVHDEIDRFFSAAENIVKGNDANKVNYAMSVITNGCSDSTDVTKKKVDFFLLLKNYGIVEDDRDTYYSPDDFSSNLEDRRQLLNFPDDDDTEQALKFVSHINKLRRHVRFYEYTESEALFVSGKTRVLQVSTYLINYDKEELDGEKRAVGYAISMEDLTNILWHKLNKGFGFKDYPKSLDIVVKAKTVLSKIISHEVSVKYDELSTQLNNGTITEEYMFAHVKALREKAMTPDDITVDNIDDNLNFDPGYMSRYEGLLEAKDAQLKEKDEQIKEAENKARFDKEQHESQVKLMKDKESEQQTTIDELNEQLTTKQREIETYKVAEEARRNKATLWKGYFKIGCLVVTIVGIFALIFRGVGYAYSAIEPSLYNTISLWFTIFGSLGVLISIYNGIRWAYRRWVLPFK